MKKFHKGPLKNYVILLGGRAQKDYIRLQCIIENSDFTDENQLFKLKYKQKNYLLRRYNKIIDNNLQMGT